MSEDVKADDFIVVTIKGTQLSPGQVFALRSAVASFFMDLKYSGLGDDEHGKLMAAGYLARLNEILLLMTK